MIITISSGVLYAISIYVAAVLLAQLAHHMGRVLMRRRWENTAYLMATVLLLSSLTALGAAAFVIATLPHVLVMLIPALYTFAILR